MGSHFLRIVLSDWAFWGGASSRPHALRRWADRFIIQHRRAECTSFVPEKGTAPPDRIRHGKDRGLDLLREMSYNGMEHRALQLPADSSAGDTVYEDRRLQMRFSAEEGKRRITCHFDRFCDGKPFDCDIVLDQPKMDSMVIATPWDKDRHFYYNQKINCMRASGIMEYDGRRYTFDPATDFGTLDWGRGVWTYDNTWYWGSGNADIGGNAFGFNLGYGFGNTRAATENILFYGKAHKLDDVTFHIPESGYMDPWRITSSDSRFEMDFQPILDRAAKLDFKLLVSDQHQVFGRMSGTAVLDDGTPITVRDMVCFAEKVHNRY